MEVLKEIRDALLHLAFPHICSGCGSDLPEADQPICLRCMEALPQTYFHLYPANPIEKIFWGRLPITHATAQYYFTQGSLIQQLMHQLKYRGDQDLGRYLGTMMGYQLAGANRFLHVDALVPLPLYPAREKKRGFNQATLLCEGIASVLKKPVLKNAVARPAPTESQTKKSRVARWQNMEGRFVLLNEAAVAGKHILLVDDVITTGATLESCGSALLRAPGTGVSIATLCFSDS